jgi:uncharacterized protein YndB with AHSA1/START domain
MAKTTPDRIERSLIIAAPRERVWNALTDSHKFSEWFNVKLDGMFEPGETIQGSVLEKDFEGLRFQMEIGQMDTERLFSWRWHPAPVNPKVDYSREPTTLVEFKLDDAPAGTRLSLVESGFTGLPAERRDAAYRMNYEGWGIQMNRIDEYVRTH